MTAFVIYELWKVSLVMLQRKSLNSDPVLTARELEILEFVAQGLSTKEVAQQIDIAPRTVDRHIENIRLKLRAKNRTHMIACAVIAGLLQVDGYRPEPMIDNSKTRLRNGQAIQ